MSEEIKITQIVKKHYAAVARKEKPCCGPSAREMGYTEDDLAVVPEANMGLGCGNPIALGEFREGETVLDLGSGPGMDCFLAARKVGETGKVIGVDMTDEMLEKARANAEKHGFKNVEFRKGYIHDLPVEDASIDIIISNCVINLAPDKAAVFRDAYRVLKPGGRMYVSDIVLLAELSPEQRSNEELIACCVGGAMLKDDYLAAVRAAGFRTEAMAEAGDISGGQYNGLPVMSLKLAAYKD